MGVNNDIAEATNCEFSTCGFRKQTEVKLYQYNFVNLWYNKFVSTFLLTTCAIFFLVPQVIQPPVDLYTVTFDESMSSVQLMCSLNIEIPSSVTVILLDGDNPFDLGPYDTVTQAGTTTTLIIGNPQQSDDGVYRCSFIGFNQQPVARIIRLG